MLIHCPECGTEVSDMANQCPKCAYPLKSINTTKSEDQGCFLQTMNAGCQIIAVIGIIIMVLIILQLNGC
jgi:uncharacterized membrane protein YvbJ